MAVDWKQTYLIGIRDGVRLAQSKTVREAEEISAEIEADINADLCAVRAELARRNAAKETGHPLQPQTGITERKKLYEELLNAHRQQAYQSGLCDGYNRAITELQPKIDELVDQLRMENHADLEALRAKIEAARAEVAQLRETDDTAETERDSEPRLN